MDPKKAYNEWAQQYDANENKTRDLEALALKEMLASLDFDHCLELGCGTGKNTVWLVNKAKHITAVDYSDEMLSHARKKITSQEVEFVQADLNESWPFDLGHYDIAVFSLVLEHIENLDLIFQKVVAVLKPSGYLYVGELHPFKQYMGTKARFETTEGLQIVECYTHHITDFIDAAQRSGLSLVRLDEYFDEDNRNSIPRILSILFRRSTFN
jgi:ubiquinone/menaquinone biosynthesis C-methylase UbiE